MQAYVDLTRRRFLRASPTLEQTLRLAHLGKCDNCSL